MEADEQEAIIFIRDVAKSFHYMVDVRTKLQHWKAIQLAVYMDQIRFKTGSTAPLLIHSPFQIRPMRVFT